MLNVLLLILSILLPGWTHGVYCGPDQAPAAAAAMGYTCEVLWDNFKTLNSIDVNNTGNPSACSASSDNSYGNTFGHSCNWFPITGDTWPPSATPSSAYSLAPGGGLSLTPATELYGGLVNTCVYSASAPGYQGWGVTGGFYIDITATWTGTISSGTDAAGWTFPISMYLNVGTYNWSENDIFEVHYGRTFHYTTVVNGSATNSYTERLDTSLVVPGVIGFADIPGSPEAMEFYFNDTLISGDILYAGPGIVPYTPSGPLSAPTGTYSGYSAQTNCIILTAGPTNPMVVTKIQIWQAPP
jgi:hypothetical protein